MCKPVQGTTKKQADRRTPILGTNDLEALYQDIAKEWDTELNGGLTPDLVFPSSSMKAHWECEKGHKWVAIVDGRTRFGNRCPYCYGKKAIPGENDLATLFPEIVQEWDYAENDKPPEIYRPGSNAKVSWVCYKGHSWKARIADRVKGTKCPYCAGKVPIVGVNDLGTQFPCLSKEWDYGRNGELRPEHFLSNSDKVVYWICEHNHSWKTSIGNRAHRNSNCPYCAQKLPVAGVNDLGTTHPQLSEEWLYDRNNLLPEHVMAGTKKKVWWECKRGHIWEASIASRANGAGCPFCSGRLPIRGETDLASQNPWLAAQWDYNKNLLTPEEVSLYSNKKVWWRCACGNSWQSSVYNRNKGNRCPKCHNQ